MTWDEIVESIRPELEGMHAARERALKESRALIQVCSKCIRHVHRKQFDEAATLLAQAKDMAAQSRRSAAPHPEILHAGYLQDAEKEMVEAAAVLAMACNEALPDVQSLGVSIPSFLNGMGEAASEARRFLLDEMRAGRHEEAERILAVMEAIYDDLISFDYPDGLTGGLRRTTDALRAVIERTRSDLTMALGQRELIAQLERTRSTLAQPQD